MAVWMYSLPSHIERMLRQLAIVLFIVSLIATGIGGTMDLLRTGTVSREHAWNDGIYLILAAVFLLMLSRR